jgi:hypothetical protein
MLKSPYSYDFILNKTVCILVMMQDNEFPFLLSIGYDQTHHTVCILVMMRDNEFPFLLSKGYDETHHTVVCVISLKQTLKLL